jgi:non-ribosomal peptide synthetase component F
MILVTDMASKPLESVTESLVIVNDALFSAILPSDNKTPDVSSQDAACVLFSVTGSRTKEPRGITFSHAALSTAFLAQGRPLNIDATSRVMQLSSYSVDTALAEILLTLIHGGCVCIPSATERVEDLAGAIRRMGATWTYMTPILARRIDPSSVPSVKVVCFRTRKLDEDIFAPWMAKSTILLAYGASDVCPLGISILEVNNQDDLHRVSQPILGKFWVVNPEDHRNLVPIGAIGELVIASPTLARRFTSGPQVPSSPLSPVATIDGGMTKARYFKTGHHVRYVEGGMMNFVSSTKDDIHIDGRIVCIAEVEKHMRRYLGNDVDVAVELVAARDSQPVLAAFVELGVKLFDGPEDLARLSSTTKERINIAKKLVEPALRSVLPAHMIPACYIPVKALPITPSLKIDRRKLQKMVRCLSNSQLMSLACVASVDNSNANGTKPLPLTLIEENMRNIWASILEIDAGVIGGNQGFMKIGGGDFLAAKMVIVCRQFGMNISLTDVLQNKTMTELCQGITLTADNSLGITSYAGSATPLTHNSMALEQMLQDEIIQMKLNVDKSEIRDIAEATSSQIRFLETALLKGRADVNYFVFNFNGFVPAQKLETACRVLTDIHPILRTAFVAHDRKVYQVALQSFVPEFKKFACPGWRLSNLTEKLIKKDQADVVNLARPITKFIFLDSGRQSTLVMRLSKSQYDDVSASLLLQDLKRIYSNTQAAPQRPSYFDFVRSMQPITSQGALEHWTSLLDGAKMTQILPHTKPQPLTSGIRTVKQRITASSLSNLGFSFDTILKAAWARVLATLSGSGDVVFGELIDGRHMRLPNGYAATGIVGPTTNTIPVRVCFPDTPTTPLQLLQSVHSQRVSGIPFENLGFLEVVEKCTKWPYWTRFSTVVHHRDADIIGELSSFNLGAASCKFNIEESMAQDVYDLLITSTQQRTNKIELAITFCENHIPVTFVDSALKMLCSAIELLTSTSMMHPILPSSVDYGKMVPQVPLPQPNFEPKPSQLGFLLPAEQQTAILTLISNAWTQILDPRSLGVPEAQLNYAAFYDLWGSLLTAAQLAEYLNRELPTLNIPGLENISIAMEEIIEHPTILRQFELVARKLRDTEEPRRKTAAFSPRSPTAWGRSIRRLASTVREKPSADKSIHILSPVDVPITAMKLPSPKPVPIAELDERGSMESMTSGSSRSDVEEEDIVSPLSPNMVCRGLEGHAGLTKKTSVGFVKLSTVSPVSVISPK